MRLTLPLELQELVDQSAQDTGVSKQTKLLEIINLHFSEVSRPAPPLTPTSFAASLLESALEKEHERYKQLYLEHEWLKGEYALLSTKLLPAAERTMTPWYSRLKRWLLEK